MLTRLSKASRADVSAGRKRLQVAATCAKSTTGASSMGDGKAQDLQQMLNSIITVSEVESTG